MRIFHRFPVRDSVKGSSEVLHRGLWVLRIQDTGNVRTKEFTPYGNGRSYQSVEDMEPLAAMFVATNPTSSMENTWREEGKTGKQK